MSAREAFPMGEWLEKRRRRLVVHGQERELVTPIEENDDPRRPAAEASAPVVEEHRTTQGSRLGHARAIVRLTG
jgi:hypothetical protein